MSNYNFWVKSSFKYPNIFWDQCIMATIVSRTRSAITKRRGLCFWRYSMAGYRAVVSWRVMTWCMSLAEMGSVEEACRHSGNLSPRQVCADTSNSGKDGKRPAYACLVCSAVISPMSSECVNSGTVTAHLSRHLERDRKIFLLHFPATLVKSSI